MKGRPNVLHIIDTLATGGTELVAIQLVNNLENLGFSSFLCVSRADGPLRSRVKQPEKIIFLNRKSRFDLKAIWKLIKFIKKNNIQIIHAHSYSVLLGWMTTWFTSSKLIWHDHYGLSDLLEFRPRFPLNWLIRRVHYIITVNEALRFWIYEKLNFSKNKISTLPNFIDPQEKNMELLTPLPGQEGKRIICLANLRPQKDQKNLIQAFETIFSQFPEWSLLLVGKDFQDAYSKEIHQQIKLSSASRGIHYLGVRTDVPALLKQCTIGALSSYSEGAPLSLLEYGLAQLPVVCTNVGACGEPLENGKYGILIPPQDSSLLAKSLINLISSPQQAQELAKKFHDKVLKDYSKDSILKKVVTIYEMVLTESS